jgi:damage-control phosphatase, subfamily I
VKTALECLPCYLRQALQVVRLSTDDAALHIEALRKVAELTSKMDMDKTPPENSIAVYNALAEITACPDPYSEIKVESNQQALALRPQFTDMLAKATDPLALALRLAIGGNIIDYGAMHSFDTDKALDRCLQTEYAVDDGALLLQRLRKLDAGAKLLYLADNSGEIVYDFLVVRELAGMGLDVTVAVKSRAIINDALLADAHSAGIDSYATLLENGTGCPGTPLDCCSKEFLTAFENADLILSKGQGNFETLSESQAEIFFLLTVKCPVVGVHLAEISGTAKECLPGDGELALYYYNGTNNDSSYSEAFTTKTR